MNLSSNWILFALGSAFFAALTSLFGKLGVAEINSNLATLIRTIVIFVLIATIVSWRDEWQMPSTIPGRTWLFLILSGVATGLSWLCFYRALQIGLVSKVAPIDKLSVAFAIVLGALFLGEKLTWPTLIGGGLIVLGSIVTIAF